MDPQARRVIDWALSSANQLQLQVTRYIWPDLVGASLTDCWVEFTQEGQKFGGRGSDPDPQIAFLKGLHEALDRLLFVKLRVQDTNGCAVHLTPHQAAQAARLELVERDRFFGHFLTGRQFSSSLMDADLESAEGFGSLLGELRARGVEVQFADMISHPEASFAFAICRSRLRSFGDRFEKGYVHIGLGAAPGNSALQARRNALTEVLRGAAAQLFRSESEGAGLEPLSVEEFTSLKNQGVQEHLRLCRDPVYAQEHVSPWIERVASPDDTVPSTAPVDVPLSQIQIISIPLSQWVKGCPSHAARALASASGGVGQAPYRYHPLFFGTVSPEKVDLVRLSAFSGRRIEWSDINESPHPLS